MGTQQLTTSGTWLACAEIQAVSLCYGGYRLGRMGQVVRVRAEIAERMVEEARREPGLECCGLLGGSGGVISAIFPATNALGSATAYEVAPEELFRVFREMRAAGLRHLGIYHSHPVGDNWPSPRDVERAYYPEAAYFVLSPRPDAPRPVRAFSIRNAQVSELTIEVDPLAGRREEI